MDIKDRELNYVFKLFFNEDPCDFKVINTSHGDNDFREVIIAEWNFGRKFVIKLADNDFTFADKIKMWKRCADEYCKLGYYCPKIIPSKDGDYPLIKYKGHNCIAYAEEYAKYNSADKFELSDNSYIDDAFIMTAKIAAAKYNFTDYSSGYCLFDTFCPSDEVDEVMQNALEWKKYAQTLPKECQLQVQRIWERWTENRSKLELIYRQLPTSVFQADLNTSNILLDENQKFVGVFDFNLCGKDVFLNYLFREIRSDDDDEEVNRILDILKKVSSIYDFSDIEKQSAILLYRCIKPLWFTKIQKLKAAGNDISEIKLRLDETEKIQTKVIDFSFYMTK